MKITDSVGGVNHTVPVSNGVLRPPHVERIGPAFPLFLKFEDMVTGGRGTDGLVLGGKPVKDEMLANSLGIHRKTVATHRRRLEKHGYISTTRTPYGLTISVRRSKKWALIQVREEMERNGSLSNERRSKITPSETRDGAKPLPEMERLSASDGAKPLPAKKTIQKTDSQKTKEPAQAEKQPSPLFPGAKAEESNNQVPKTDPRHQAIVGHYFARSRKAGVDPDFDRSDARALADFLKRNPSWTVEMIIRRLDNAFDSTDPYPLKLGFRLREFLPHSAKYARGPIHRGNAVSIPMENSAEEAMEYARL